MNIPTSQLLRMFSGMPVKDLKALIHVTFDFISDVNMSTETIVEYFEINMPLFVGDCTHCILDFVMPWDSYRQLIGLFRQLKDVRG